MVPKALTHISHKNAVVVLWPLVKRWVAPALARRLHDQPCIVTLLRLLSLLLLLLLRLELRHRQVP